MLSVREYNSSYLSHRAGGRRRKKDDGWRMVATVTLLPGIFCLSIRLTGRMDGVFIGIEVQPLKFSPCSSAVLLQSVQGGLNFMAIFYFTKRQFLNYFNRYITLSGGINYNYHNLSEIQKILCKYCKNVVQITTH